MKLKGPQTVLTVLYIAVVARTFTNEAPPMAYTSLLLAALTLVIVGHLQNVYDVADLLEKQPYPKALMAIDLLLIGLFALVFQCLAHPVAAAKGMYVTVDSFRKAGVPPEPEIREALVISTGRAFSLLAASLIPLVAWHVVLQSRKYKSLFRAPNLRLHALGWILFAAMASYGIGRTRCPSLSDDSIRELTHLAVIAVLFAGLFLVAATDPGTRYRSPHSQSGATPTGPLANTAPPGP